MMLKKGWLAGVLIGAAIFQGSCVRDHYPTAADELQFALFAASQGLWKEARFRFENLVQRNPNNVQAHNNLAVALEALGLFAEAEAEYVRAINLDPNNDYIKENFRNLRQILKEKNKEKTPEKDKEKAVQS